jgi:hypothetical protein
LRFNSHDAQKPSCDKLIALDFGMHLSLDETQKLLADHGYNTLLPD